PVRLHPVEARERLGAAEVREDDPSVRQPRERPVPARPVRDAVLVGAVRVHDPDLAAADLVMAVGDPAAVRGPRAWAVAAGPGRRPLKAILSPLGDQSANIPPVGGSISRSFAPSTSIVKRPSSPLPNSSGR